MSFRLSRTAASYSIGVARMRHVAFTILLLMVCNAVADAVVVRGRVTDALGKPVPGARVQLIEAGKVEAMAYAGPDGTYEIRDADSGRFTLLSSANGYFPAVGSDFYGGGTDVVQQDVVLAGNTVKQEVSVTATGIPTPLPQLTSPVSVIPEEAFALDTGVADEIRQTAGAFVVQTGQLGGVTSLFLRGGNSTANLVMIDGIPAGDVGGIFDYGVVSSTAIGQIELVRGPDSAMYGTDAGAGVIAISTPRGTTLEPVVNYSGDAGNLHTYRNEISVGGTLQRLDYYAAFSRLDSSNALQYDEFHSGTSAVNFGYNFNGTTQMRFTLRNADSVQGIPGPYDFQGVSQSNRQGDQDIFSGITLENRYKGDWHNLVRYGISRKRDQEQEFQNVGNYLAYDPGNYGPGYVGNVVTIKGANGYSATGQVQLYNGNNDDQDSNRDQVYYQSDYSFSPHFVGLFGFRFDDESGSFNDYDPAYAYTEHEKIKRTNFEYNLQFQGEFFSRLFYSAGGAVEKNHLYGIAGTPRLGLSYVPVRPNGGFFHGTRFRANAATGVQEPTLALEYESLYTQLEGIPNGPGYIAQFHVGKPGAERSRTYDVGLDQNVIGEKLVLKLGYFHNVFDHQIEGVSAEALAQYFHIGTPEPNPPGTSPCGYNTPVDGLCPLPNLYTAYLNSLAFRAPGEEAELVWHPRPRFLVRGGYTHLDAKVIQSFSSDALAAQQGSANANPNFPNTPIGVSGPLAGARPFRRAPNTGYFNALYSGKRISMVFKGAMASRSDDSTFLEYEDLNGGNTLLLPNRNLDYGYVKLDVGGTYAWKHGASFFAELDNLLNDQHIGPIGYPGLPLTVRAGIKLRLGGD